MMKNKTEKSIYELKATRSSLQSRKEIFVIIYFPVQLALWTLDEIEIRGVNATGLIMIFFTIIFAVLLDRINKLLFNVEMDIEQSERIKGI